MNTGDTAYFTVDSLSAFWPGLQVLAGDIQSAIKLHMLCSYLSLLVRRIFDAARQIIISGENTPDFLKCTIRTSSVLLLINILFAQVSFA